MHVSPHACLAERNLAWGFVLCLAYRIYYARAARIRGDLPCVGGGRQMPIKLENHSYTQSRRHKCAGERSCSKRIFHVYPKAKDHRPRIKDLATFMVCDTCCRSPFDLNLYHCCIVQLSGMWISHITLIQTAQLYYNETETFAVPKPSVLALDNCQPALPARSDIADS